MPRSQEERKHRIEECLKWFYSNEAQLNTLTDQEKLEQLTLYAMARFLVSRGVARDYALAVLSRVKIADKLPESKLTDFEIQRRRRLEEELKKAKQQAEQNPEEQQLKSKWGDVPIVDETQEEGEEEE